MVSLRENAQNMAIKNLIRPRAGANTYRIPFPPEFYNAKDEIPGHYYPTRARFQSHMTEDIGNYGTGGYYGNTYRSDYLTRKSGGMQDRSIGRRDTYRQLGDRQW